MMVSVMVTMIMEQTKKHQQWRKEEYFNTSNSLYAAIILRGDSRNVYGDPFSAFCLSLSRPCNGQRHSWDHEGKIYSTSILLLTQSKAGQSHFFEEASLRKLYDTNMIKY